MARLPRVVVADVAHHVTQRGNARRYILDRDSDRQVYLELLRNTVVLYQVSVIGYCLMSNHVHVVVIPPDADSLAQTFKQTHGRYASYWNATHGSSGHVWQGRYYSCPLDTPHLWAALRYAELNPVRAGLVETAAAWPWSSAGAHCGTAPPDALLAMELWRKNWTHTTWRQFLDQKTADSELESLRQCTHTGRPLGAPEFVERLERATHRQLKPAKGGRPTAKSKEEREALLFGS